MQGASSCFQIFPCVKPCRIIEMVSSCKWLFLWPERREADSHLWIFVAGSWCLSPSVWSVAGVQWRAQTQGRLLTCHPGLSLLFSRHIGWLLINCAGLGSTALPRQPALGLNSNTSKVSQPPHYCLTLCPSQSCIFEMFFILVSSSTFYSIPVTSDFSPAVPALLVDFSVHSGTWSCGFAPQTPRCQRGQAERRWLWGAGVEVGEGLLFPFPSSVARRAFGGERTLGVSGGGGGEAHRKAAFPWGRSLRHWFLGAGRTPTKCAH